MSTVSVESPPPRRAMAERVRRRNDRWLRWHRAGTSVAEIAEDSVYSRRAIERGIREAERRERRPAEPLSLAERQHLGRTYGPHSRHRADPTVCGFLATV